MDQMNDLLPDILRSIQADMAIIKRDVRDIRARLGEVDEHVLGLRRDVLSDAGTSARQQSEMDELRDRVERIESRLKLRDE